MLHLAYDRRNILPPGLRAPGSLKPSCCGRVLKPGTAVCLAGAHRGMGSAGSRCGPARGLVCWSAWRNCRTCIESGASPRATEIVPKIPVPVRAGDDDLVPGPFAWTLPRVVLRSELGERIDSDHRPVSRHGPVTFRCICSGVRVDGANPSTHDLPALPESAVEYFPSFWQEIRSPIICGYRGRPRRLGRRTISSSSASQRDHARSLLLSRCSRSTGQIECCCYPR